MSTLAQTRQAYSEIDEFIGLLNEDERNRIPSKLRQFFKEEKDQNYVKNIDVNIPIKDQNLKQETINLIAFLNLRYICQDEDEKARLQAIYQENENKYQKALREKYNPDNIFKNKVTKDIQGEPNIEKVEIIEYKEQNFIQKIIRKIIKVFKGNKE